MLRKVEEHLHNLGYNSHYDVPTFLKALEHQVSQLDFFYTTVVKKGEDPSKVNYKIPMGAIKEHSLVYINLGRGFPKEIADGHWCYVWKLWDTKALVIPCTSIKLGAELRNPRFQLDILVSDQDVRSTSRLQLSDIRSVDLQRLHVPRGVVEVLTPRSEIMWWLVSRMFRDELNE